MGAGGPGGLGVQRRSDRKGGRLKGSMGEAEGEVMGDIGVRSGKSGGARVTSLLQSGVWGREGLNVMHLRALCKFMTEETRAVGWCHDLGTH